MSNPIIFKNSTRQEKEKFEKEDNIQVSLISLFLVVSRNKNLKSEVVLIIRDRIESFTIICNMRDGFSSNSNLLYLIKLGNIMIELEQHL
jgi:hypothetical protein